MRKQIVIPKVALQVAGLFPVDSINLGHVEAQFMEVSAERQEGLVFFPVFAIGAYQRTLVGDDSVILPRRARGCDGHDLDGCFADGACQFGYYVLNINDLHGNASVLYFAKLQRKNVISIDVFASYFWGQQTGK